MNSISTVFSLILCKTPVNFLNQIHKSVMSEQDAVEQLFVDDPWLKPFEGEIRRR